MRKFVFGYKSIMLDMAILVVFNIFFGCLQPQNAATIIIGISLFFFVYGFFFYSIVVIDQDSISVKYLLNIFNKKKIIPLKEVRSIKLVHNSFHGGGTSAIWIQFQEKKIRLINGFRRFELKRMAEVLRKKSIETDILLW